MPTDASFSQRWNARCSDDDRLVPPEESYALLNTYLNEKGDLRPTLDKHDSKTRAQIDRIEQLVRLSNNPMIQMRICSDLKEIPDSYELRWHLLRSLSNNRFLIEAVIRKLVFELGFGEEHVLLNCKDPALIEEYLARDGIPGGVFLRLRNHKDALRSGTSPS